MKEIPILGITQDIVDRSPKRVFPFSKDTLSHMSMVQEKMSKEQKDLYLYLTPLMNDYFMFKLGATLTYDMIPQSHKTEPLTLDQISAADKSISEHGIKNPETNKATLLDPSWFNDKLKKDSPPFADWVNKTLDGIDKEQNRFAFLFGVLLVALPFLMRAEARAMEQKLFPH